MREEPEYKSQFTTEIQVWKLLYVVLYLKKKTISWIFNDLSHQCDDKMYGWNALPRF